MPDDLTADADLPEQMRVRQDKRARLLAEGREPYPVSVPRTHSLREVRRRWGGLAVGEETQDVVGVTGRVVFIRNTGKLCFATLQEGLSLEDSGVRLQVMLSLAEVGEEALADWKADVDLGDFVFVRGRVISSKRGELSVLAASGQIAAKALRPMPNLHTELSDETRVRQRYADLTVREAARDMVRTRAAITRSIRETLHREGYVEIETPVLQLVHGGANARPFRTHLNAFDIDMTLRIALELFLKRAVVGGVEQVYELGRIFRNEGIDSTHSAEFTMLEVYQAWGDQRSIAALTQQLIVDVADLLGSRRISSPAGEINLDGEWPWLGVYPGLSELLGEEVTPETTAERAAQDRRAARRGVRGGLGRPEVDHASVPAPLQHGTDQLKHPLIRDPLAKRLIRRSWQTRSKNFSKSISHDITVALLHVGLGLGDRLVGGAPWAKAIAKCGKCGVPSPLKHLEHACWISRSITHGIPSLRFSWPPGLGISTRLIVWGWYVP